MGKDTEKTILETAKQHFVQYGFAATRMQDIADEAGINKAMLHYYFRSKEKLYLEIINRTLDEVVPKFISAMQSEGDIWHRIEHLVGTYVKALIENPHVPFFVTSELSQKRTVLIEAVKKRISYLPIVQGFVGQVMAEMEAGRIRKMPIEHLMFNVVGMTVFPFLAKPIFVTVFTMEEEHFVALMEQRKTYIMQFLRAALDVRGDD